MSTDINISTWANRLFTTWIIVFVISIWLFIFTSFYSNSLENKQLTLIETKKDLEQSISDLKKEKIVEVYNLVKINSSLIEKKEFQSNIRNIISNIKSLSEKYSIVFANFNYNKWNTSLFAAAQSDVDKTAYSKVSTFIWDFRSENTEIFTMPYVWEFSWQNLIKFNVNLNLK